MLRVPWEGRLHFRIGVVHLAPPGTAAQPVFAQVGADGEKPVPETALWVITGQLAIGLNKGILRKVFRLVSIPHPGQRHKIDPVLIPLYDLSIRILPSVHAFFYQYRVGWMHLLFLPVTPPGPFSSHDRRNIYFAYPKLISDWNDCIIFFF